MQARQARIPLQWSPRAALVLAVLSILAACSTDNPAQLRAVSAEYLATLLVEQNFAAWSGYFRPGARVNGSDLGATVMQGYARGLHHAFPDMTLAVLEQIAAGDSVVTHFVIKGTHQRAFNALPPTNRAVELEGVAIDHYEAGLIVDTRLILDISRLASSLAGARRTPVD